MLQRLGKFEILKRLGQGAMGEVYLGKDPSIGREVAIKTIHREAAQGAEARERFAREARAAGTLSHPNVVTIHEFGEDQGVLYLAMEYVPGADLEAMLRDRVLRPVEVLEVLAQVCDGLAYAHQKGVLHRDIKPSNIRVQVAGDRLHAKIMDFGVARIAGSDMTGTGTLMGTFGYMAPEYIQTGQPDPRSDLFAVGVILYEGLTGRRPFVGDTTATVLYRIVHEDPEPLSAEDLGGISPRAGALLAMSLAKNPKARFASAEAMARALRSAMDPRWPGLQVGEATVAMSRPVARSQPAAPRPASTPRRWPWAAGAVLALAACVGGWFALRPAPPRLITLSPPDHQPIDPAAGKPEAASEHAPVRPAARPQHEKPRPQALPPMSEAEASDLLNEAAKGFTDQPQDSLVKCDRVLHDHPLNPRAYALKVVALYRLGRYTDIPGVLDAGKEKGVKPAQYLAFGAFTAMLREERRDHNLPREVRESLVAELPAGALRQGLLFQRKAAGQRPSRD
jgi:tRNA A-37 threonylcarbamoyl transferase component Bud32